jgi:hypothetical protein
MGRFIPADEAFEAWMSGDLERMLAARSVKTNPVDRHFLLQSIVKETYRRRSEPQMRRLCIETGMMHLAEFQDIAPALRLDMGDKLPRVPSFAWLATALADGGQLDEAAAVCERATQLGADDGTKGGYPGRAGRLRARKRTR